ncbi:hypothetical protein ACA910_013428 [Epithemia clementina (nom. ined.)]
MAMLRKIALLLLTIGAVSAFAPLKPAATKSVTSIQSDSLSDPQIYEGAVADWEKQFPAFAKWGWGPSVQAEKWNGRHAMFGWLFICATAYCKGHGLIPDPEATLDLSKWGTLAIISGKTTITNERAIVLVANMHFFFLSLMAAACPLPFSDPLLSYGPPKEGYGFMPAMKLGLTEEAEILNGRMAMLGLFALVISTAIEGKDMLDIVNEWVGGLYY